MLDSALILFALALVAGLLLDLFRYSLKFVRALIRAIRAFGATPRRA
jgi:hypothetical protein